MGSPDHLESNFEVRSFEFFGTFYNLQSNSRDHFFAFGNLAVAVSTVTALKRVTVKGKLQMLSRLAPSVNYWAACAAKS